MDREAWETAAHGVAESDKRQGAFTALQPAQLATHCFCCKRPLQLHAAFRLRLTLLATLSRPPVLGCLQSWDFPSLSTLSK